MSPSQPKKTTLPLNEKTANQLVFAICDHSLMSFFATHEITLEHFRLITSAETTPFHIAAAKGELPAVNMILKASGQKLTLEHLLTKIPCGDTLFHYATEGGHLDHIWEILAASGERPTAPHLMSKGMSGETPIQIATRNAGLHQIFSPSLWIGRTIEMTTLWKCVPEGERHQIDYDTVLKETIWQSVHRPKPQAIDGAGMTRPAPEKTDRNGLSREPIPAK